MPDLSPATPDRPADARPLHVVFGASGYIGSTRPRAAALGAPRAPTARNVEVLEARAGPAPNSPARTRSTRRPCPPLAGADVAYYLVHSMAAGSNFGAIDRWPRRTSRAPPPPRACGASSTSAA